MLLSRRGGLSGATLIARGGRGGDGWRTQAPGGFPGERHGPGGGGGGGFVAASAAAHAASSVIGGPSGITTTANDPFGAQPGAPGTIVAHASFDEIAGLTSACTVPLQRLVVSKSFAPASVVRNQASDLTITLTNPNASEAISGIDLVDAYLVGLENVASPAPATTCSGANVSTPDGRSLQLTGGSLGAGGQCTVTVRVASPLVGSYTNTIAAGAVTTANAGATLAPVSATLGVRTSIQSGPPTRPAVAKAFSPGVAPLGGVSTLSIRVINATADPFTSLTFVDAYPPGLTNAAAPNVTNTCGGTVFASPGGSSVSLVDGTIPPFSNCTVTVDVVSAVAATYPNTIESGAVQVAETEPSVSAATAVLVVSALAPPTVVKSFAPVGVSPGQPSRLTIRVVNPNPTPLTGVTFTDDFPPGLVVAEPPEATSSCGDFAAFPGVAGVALEGGSVPASGECAISVLVVAADSVTGTVTNTIPAGAIVSANAPASAAPASASLAILPTGAPAIPIPLLSPAALGVLAALLAVIAVLRMRARDRR